MYLNLLYQELPTLKVRFYLSKVVQNLSCFSKIHFYFFLEHCSKVLKTCNPTRWDIFQIFLFQTTLVRNFIFVCSDIVSNYNQPIISKLLILVNKTKTPAFWPGLYINYLKLIKKDIRKFLIREPKDFLLGLILVSLMQSLLQKNNNGKEECPKTNKAVCLCIIPERSPLYLALPY